MWSAGLGIILQLIGIFVKHKERKKKLAEALIKFVDARDKRAVQRIQDAKAWDATIQEALKKAESGD